MIDASTIALFLIALALGGYVVLRHPERLPDAMRQIRTQFGSLCLRMPLALLAASLLSGLLPTDMIAPLIGETSGWTGIVIACMLGGLLPGGPMISFPLALVIWDMGAGQVQMIGFLTSWSVYALHRMLSYELPLMGGRFVLIRMGSSWMMPLVAALLASAILLIRV